MTVIDVIQPYMPGASNIDDHIEVTCVPSARVVIPEVTEPTLHPALSAAATLVRDGQLSEGVAEALRLIEERVRSLTARDDSGRTLMESVFGGSPPQLDITTTTGQTAEDEREGFRLLFIGAVLGLAGPHSAGPHSAGPHSAGPHSAGPHSAGTTVPATMDEALEYLAVASMLMRRLDRAENRLG